MNLRTVALVSGLVGGLCWVARWFADSSGSSTNMLDALYYAGLVLLAVALAGVGANLANKGAVWLKAIVAVAFPLLVWSVVSVIKGDGDGIVVEGVAGAVAVLLVVVVAVRARQRRPKEVREPSDPVVPRERRRRGRSSGTHSR